MPKAGMTNCDSLHKGHPFGRSPIAHDGKSDWFGAFPGNEICMTAIGKSGAVTCFLPTADEIFKSGNSLGCHDEGQVRFVTAANSQLIRIHSAFSFTLELAMQTNRVRYDNFRLLSVGRSIGPSLASAPTHEAIQVRRRCKTQFLTEDTELTVNSESQRVINVTHLLIIVTR
jgi:hypothetical protein